MTQESSRRPGVPMSLWSQCLDYCIRHQEALCHPTGDDHCRLYDWVYLPLEVCQSLLEAFNDHYMALDDRVLHIFTDTARTRLKSLTLRNSHVTDPTLAKLLDHGITKLDISGCSNLSVNTIGVVNRKCHNLRILNLGSGTGIHVNWLLEPLDFTAEDRDNFVFRCPQLEVLSVHCLKATAHRSSVEVAGLIASMLRSLHSLTYLDLTSCSLDLDNLEQIGVLQCLRSLILHDVNLLCHYCSEAFERLIANKRLRLLDISMARDSVVVYPDPDENLEFLVEGLPNLQHLDISGTNLAGMQAAEGFQEPTITTCAIAGLGNRHFEFLGLLGCAFEACERQNIPADQVTGSANEEQVLLSVQHYVDRSPLLAKALNRLFQIARFSKCHDEKRAYEVILAAMKRHPMDNHIQTTGSASLFYIMRSEVKNHLETHLKRRLISAVLNGMSNHMSEPTMLRNGCLILCQFHLPRDVVGESCTILSQSPEEAAPGVMLNLFAYERMVSTLLQMVSRSFNEEFLQRIGIYLLNSLACQVDGEEKQLLGDKGVIEIMLGIIERKLTLNQNDEVMDVAWSTMWNVTDETPSNCQRFLDRDGMDYFLRCLQKIEDRAELLRNMMGLLGNVAEVGVLRKHLMKPEYVKIFVDLLESSCDGIEVSYNACGVLSHMVSDGPTAWTVLEPSRFSVQRKMVEAVRCWNLQTKRNINYRSFEPILRLVPRQETPEAQLWAVWALCNLTKMYRKKYCPLLEAEGGLALLRDIGLQTEASQETKALAEEVLKRCQCFHDEPEYDSSGEGPGDDADE